MVIAQRIGQSLGVVTSLVFSPVGMALSWLMQPYIFRVQMAMSSHSKMLQLFHEFQHVVRTYPLETISGLLLLLVLILTLGIAYTAFMANLGGKLAVRVSRINFSELSRVLSIS